MLRHFCAERCFKLAGSFPGAFTDILLVEPCLHSRFGFCVSGREEGFYLFCQTAAELVFAKVHAQAVFRVVFKEGVCPGRAEAFLVGGVRHGRGACTVNGGASRSVGDVHAVAEELGHQMYIRGFAAACAGAGEFEIGRFQHSAADGLLVERIFLVRQAHGIVPEFLLRKLCFDGLHYESLLPCRAGVDADAAAVAVFRINDNAEFQALLRSLEVTDDESFRCFFHFFFRSENRTDRGVRTGSGALVAFNAVFRNPFRYFNCRGGPFILGRACREGAVFHAFEGGNREIVPFLAVHHVAYVRNESRAGSEFSFAAGGGMGPGFRYRYFYRSGNACVDSGVVHVYHILAFSAVRMLICFLQVLHRIRYGDDFGESEEGRLHDHIDAASEADLFRNFESVHNVEFRMKLGELSLHHGREHSVQLFRLPGTVQQENTAVFEAPEQVILVYVGRAVAGDIVSVLNEVRTADRIRTEAQMGNGDAAGFLGVIRKVALGVHIGVVADDLDGVLVGADRAVRTEAPEFARYSAVFSCGHIHRCERQIRHVILNAEGKVVGRTFFFQMFINGHHIFRHHVLGAQAIAASADADIQAGCGDSTLYIQVERFAERARFAGAVEDSHFLDRLRKSGDEVLHRERTVEVNCDNAHFFAARIERVSYIFGNVCDGADGDDDAVRVFRTVIIKEMVLPSGDLGDLIHVALYDFRKGIVERIGRFAVLEVHIRIFRGAADDRMIRGERMRPEFRQRFLINERRQVLVIDDMDLLDFMACAESVEEIDERNPAFDGSQMRYRREIHHFLHIGFRQHGAAGRSGRHNILVIAENRERMVCQRPGSDMEYTGKQLAGHFIHGRNHEQHPLGSGISRREGTALERAVERAGCAAFCLHFNYMHGIAEKILFPMSGPFIHRFSHRRRRRDRINGGYFGERVGNIGSSCISIHCFHVFH